ncbi:NADH oxidoreductase complex RnfABCDGE type, C subunit [Alteracholeplasma palmae J233]|uniref:Ion-translocating oxidoreductase complex subunit C n=1 Tax=Alteracholeplasma palmae (strain ATCC 49389 / J233) TaxID=1318466 RepID=U4KLT7_ALTPJ|nr:RnfABCDGE type electron transport complex subunit C [Alteracholeplasma palmae]CCV64954.1 NADH oxidoreductase complex RnfABCDGE type, C subunit [Alteracholeplasma palmae J233]
MIQKTREIPDGKKVLKKLPILHYLDADYLYYPITNQRCPEGETCVIMGQFVKVGEEIGVRKGAFFEQPIHATASGEIMGYEKKMDQSGRLVDCLIVKNDKKYELHESIYDRTDEEIMNLTKQDFIDIAKNSGLVGLGGSGFPTYIKLNAKHPVDIVVANGVECEPNLISDYEILMRHPEEMILGLIYSMKAVGAKKGIIAIKEKNKELEARLSFAIKDFPQYDLKVKLVGNYYPQGWELETIKSATGIKIPQGKITSEYGIINFNVSTLVSLYHAVKKRLPVLERFFTISGDGAHNKNFRVRIGTSIEELLELAGGYKDLDLNKTLIVGGPMMGTSVSSSDLVLTHTMTSLIINNEVVREEEPCIHCASCVYSCPVEIQPVQIMNAFKRKDTGFLVDLAVNKCIECGLCSFVCPSKIHLTDYMRKGKALLKTGGQ